MDLWKDGRQPKGTIVVHGDCRAYVVSECRLVRERVTLRCAHQHASIIMRLSFSLPFAQTTVPGRKWSECGKSGE
jgi:hypothetical protein